MDLDRLRCLVALADEGALRRAAAALCLSPPAAHKRLKLLEEELGVALYGRSGRGLRLTPAAEALLPHARALLAQHDAALAAVEAWKGGRAGRVRVGAGPTFGSHVLPELLLAYRRRHAGVEVAVEVAPALELAAALAAGRLDLAFLVAADRLDGAFEPVARWAFRVPLVAHAARPLPDPLTPDRLGREPFVLYRRGSIFDDLLVDYFARIGVQPREGVRLNSAEVVKGLVRADLGVSMLPAWMVTEPVRDGLRLPALAGPPLVADITLAARPAGLLPPAARAFADGAAAFSWGALEAADAASEPPPRAQ